MWLEIVLIYCLCFHWYQIVLLAQLIDYYVYELIGFIVVVDLMSDFVEIQIGSVNQQVNAVANHYVRIDEIETAYQQMI
jgi:hypothetical protein